MAACGAQNARQSHTGERKALQSSKLIEASAEREARGSLIQASAKLALKVYTSECEARDVRGWPSAIKTRSAIMPSSASSLKYEI